jgi:hypothetical protein
MHADRERKKHVWRFDFGGGGDCEKNPLLSSLVTWFVGTLYSARLHTHQQEVVPLNRHEMNNRGGKQT